MALALGVLAATLRPIGPRPGGQTPAREQRRTRSWRSGSRTSSKTIGQHLDAGRIAEAIPPAREKLDLLVRLRGKDHWQTGDARRDVETYEQLAARPREVQDRFAEARRGAPGETALRPGPVRPGLGAISEGPGDRPRDPGRGAPRHRHQLQQPGRDPPGPGEVRRGRGDAPPRPGDPPQGPARGPPRHRRQLQQPGRDPRGPGEVCRGRGDAPPRPGDPPEGPGRGAPRHRHTATTTWPRPSRTRGSTPRPRRCTAAPWRSA